MALNADFSREVLRVLQSDYFTPQLGNLVDGTQCASPDELIALTCKRTQEKLTLLKALEKCVDEDDLGGKARGIFEKARNWIEAEDYFRQRNCSPIEFIAFEPSKQRDITSEEKELLNTAIQEAMSRRDREAVEILFGLVSTPEKICVVLGRDPAQGKKKRRQAGNRWCATFLGGNAFSIWRYDGEPTLEYGRDFLFRTKQDANEFVRRHQESKRRREARHK